MIKNSEIVVAICSANKKYWEKVLDKTLSIGNSITTNVELLPGKSNVMIDCVCDNCGRNYTQRRSRDLSVCGYCKTKKRMTNNSYGTKNKKYQTPSKKELQTIIDSGKGKHFIAKKYSVSVPVVNRWLQENEINLSEYHGRKYFKTQTNYDEAVNSILTSLNTQTKISEISETTKLPRHIIKKLEKENDDINILSSFKVWEKQYLQVLNNIDIYVQENKQITLKEIAEKHKISIEHLKKAFKERNISVRIHSYNKSKGEIECRDFIRSLGLKCDSYMFSKKYEIDCFVQSKQFGVEYCGEYWHRYEPHKKNKKYHIDKYLFFYNQGIKVFTIFEHEWKNKKKQNILKSMISQRLDHVSTKIYGRKCELKEIDKKQAESFHEDNHISGKTTSTINIGLFFDNKLISVLSFVKSRFDKNYEYEISRFSTLLNHIVVGGFSKMFNYFSKKYNVKSCMTYADLRFGEGKVYEKSNFKLIKRTEPNYFYYDNKTGIVKNRMLFQKNKLKSMNILEYSDDKSEFEIVKAMGYFRLYDCGNNKYAWEK